MTFEQRRGEFTASLDAAMTLVPEELADWQAYEGPGRPKYNVTMATAHGAASVMPTDGKSTGIHDERAGHGHAVTPALALTAAALRARAAMLLERSKSNG